MLYREHLHRAFARLRFEPELFLNGGKYRRAGRPIGCGSPLGRPRFRRPFEGEVEKSKNPFVPVMCVTGLPS
jgi:hypothetical protein